MNFYIALEAVGLGFCIICGALLAALEVIGKVRPVGVSRYYLYFQAGGVLLTLLARSESRLLSSTLSVVLAVIMGLWLFRLTKGRWSEGSRHA